MTGNGQLAISNRVSSQGYDGISIVRRPCSCYNTAARVRDTMIILGELTISTNQVAVNALQRLIDGNKRFCEGVRSIDALASQSRRAELLDGQEPFAIILGCSDSRVPAELVFDQGLGDLFVIRVAGNIVAPSQVGSVEFSAEHHGARLVVVLGHSNCAAISTTLAELSRPSENRSANLASIVDRIRPAIHTLYETDLKNDPEALLKHAVRANIRSCVDHLRHGSRLLEQLVADEGLLIVGAEYSLETGEVEFFENMPDLPST